METDTVLRVAAQELRAQRAAPGVALRPEPGGGRIHGRVITDRRGWVLRAQSGDTLGLAKRSQESPLPTRVAATGLYQGIKTSEASRAAFSSGWMSWASNCGSAGSSRPHHGAGAALA